MTVDRFSPSITVNLQPRTKSLRLITRALTLGLAAVFAIASAACLLETALACGHDESQVAHHHPADADHGNHHGKDSPNCCTSLQSIVLPALQSNFTPDQHKGDSVVTTTVIPPSVTIPVAAGLVYDHGPPGESPPAFLLVYSVSPRSPPLSA